MPKTKNNDSSIQLKCTLCPKTPQFSDVSHLLTHISSKSHLSHRFKLQIRAQSESEAKQQLDSFDHWYHNNNLDVLLSGRLAAKEQKKSAKERKWAKLPPPDTFTKDKQELAGFGYHTPLIASSPIFRAAVPRMHLWPTTTSAAPTPEYEWEQNFVYTTPTARRQLPNFLRDETPEDAVLGGLLDPRLTTPKKKEQADDDKVNIKLSDNTRLKGIYWPGMNLFDSATPEMKRMRNQRKDGSILEQMIATSNVVEPVEFVYHADGELRNTRDIFGPLSIENSPENVKMPSPKKRKRRSPRNATFEDMSINAPMQNTRSKKNVSSSSHKIRQSQKYRSPFGRLPFKPQPTPNPLAVFGNRFMATAEEEEEFRMTIGDMPQKRSFGIFQDAGEVSPGRTESPLEETRFDFLCDGLPKFSPRVNQARQSSPSPSGKPAPMRIFGKENKQPDEQVQVQGRRPLTTSQGFPPQVFYDSAFNPLFNPLNIFYNRSTGYEFQSNLNDGVAAANAFTSDFHGDFKPLNLTPRCPPNEPTPPGYGDDPSNTSASSMHFGM